MKVDETSCSYIIHMNSCFVFCVFKTRKKKENLCRRAVLLIVRQLNEVGPKDADSGLLRVLWRRLLPV